jgi:GNAT superfamily N-acetyltransferase
VNDDEIFDEVIVTPRRAFPNIPGTRVIERPGWLQIITPSITTGGLNEVIWSELAVHEADAVIDATIAEYRALGVKFRWNVGPGSAPADLAQRLERRGLVVSWGRGMARSTEAIPQPVDRISAPLRGAARPGEAGAFDPAISIEPIDENSVELFSRVMAEGWGLDLEPLARVNRAIITSPSCRQHLYLARCDGEPAAVASHVAFPRSAYLIGGVVLPRFRRRGLYVALVQARLADARARGIPLATSHAREATSAPILERLGFTTVCRFPMYFGEPIRTGP